MEELLKFQKGAQQFCNSSLQNCIPAGRVGSSDRNFGTQRQHRQKKKEKKWQAWFYYFKVQDVKPSEHSACVVTVPTHQFWGAGDPQSDVRLMLRAWLWEPCSWHSWHSWRAPWISRGREPTVHTLSQQEWLQQQHKHKINKVSSKPFGSWVNPAFQSELNAPCILFIIKCCCSAAKPLTSHRTISILIPGENHLQIEKFFANFFQQICSLGPAPCVQNYLWIYLYHFTNVISKRKLEARAPLFH